VLAPVVGDAVGERVIGTRCSDEARSQAGTGEGGGRADVVPGRRRREAADLLERRAAVRGPRERGRVEREPVLARRGDELVHPRLERRVPRDERGVGMRRGDERARGGDVRVTEGRHEPAQVVRRQSQIGVHCDDDLRGRSGCERGVQRLRLAAAGESQRPRSLVRVRPRLHALPRSVGGAVVGEDDVETVARPVQPLDRREQPAQAPRLVVRGHEQGDARLLLDLAEPPGRKQRSGEQDRAPHAEEPDEAARQKRADVPHQTPR
jgi:hypothetical protein